MMPVLEPADVVLVRHSGIVAMLIRRFSQGRNEPGTLWDHVEVAIGPDQTIGSSWRGTGIRPMADVVADSERTQVWRLEGLQLKRKVVTERALEYHGCAYGKLKIIAHGLDGLLGGAYLFRRLCRMDNYPICSWLVAYAYDSVGERFSGLPPNAVQPDDIGDHVRADPRWELVWDSMGNSASQASQTR